MVKSPSIYQESQSMLNKFNNVTKYFCVGNIRCITKSDLKKRKFFINLKIA